MKKKFIPLSIIVFIAFTLRLINLGYSDYQGDEIKALFLPLEGSSVSKFLLDQRKGPGQFIVTGLVKLVNPTYSNEFITRLPFALAGAFSVYLFYKLIRQHFGSKIAFYSSFFMATNGFLVALSRIAQYQSFVIFFMILALYMFSKSKAKSIYLGFIFWAFSMLFHYDGVLILPFVIYLLLNFYRQDPKENLKILLNGALVFMFILSIFYIPFLFSINDKTMEYWSGRVSGGVSSKISSSRYLFTVYQPIYVIHFYTGLAILGFGIFGGLLLKKLFKIKLSFLDKHNITIPDDSLKKFAVVFAWFILPMTLLEVVVHIPGTHIYTYLIPLVIFLGLGLEFIETVLKMFKNFFIPEVIFTFFIILFFSFIYLQSYAIFVDHSKEYPWEHEKFLLWQFHKPTPIFHLSMFGFPYYRNWEGISKVIMGNDNNGYYSTNERNSISRYYVPLKKDTDKAGYYIHILNSQSFTDDIPQEKASYWASRYNPIFTFSKNSKDLVRVYSMEAGTVEEVQALGY